jgi:hypothetical protein
MLPHDLHCPTNPYSPEPVGVCQRCYRKFWLKDLQFQWDFRGNSLKNLYILVCYEDLDKPYEFNRPIIIGPDPVVPRWPSPPQYAANALGGEAGPPPLEIPNEMISEYPPYT